MQQLILCRGIPASGKSTWAKAWVHAGENRVRINRDDLRLQMFGKLTGVNEVLVTKVEDSMVAAALKAGQSVVVDDTNIRHEFVKRLAALGHAANVPVTVNQFDISLDDAKARNKLRHERGGTFVPEEVIEKMHNSLLASGPVDVSAPVIDMYEPKPDTLRAIMVDIDGTVALMNDRSPFEWHKVLSDSVVDHVVKIVRWAAEAGYQIIFMSGRDAVCRKDTIAWFDKHNVWFDRLIMRPEGDMRKDSIVKKELFDKYVRDEYNVAFVLDDRNQVVDMWRSIGLPTLQVAPGDF